MKQQMLLHDLFLLFTRKLRLLRLLLLLLLLKSGERSGNRRGIGGLPGSRFATILQERQGKGKWSKGRKRRALKEGEEKEDMKKKGWKA